MTQQTENSPDARLAFEPRVRPVLPPCDCTATCGDDPAITRGAVTPCRMFALAEEDRLRTQQAKAVMPMIGPLLDAWERIPLDLRSDMIEQAAPLMRWLGAINEAMERA